MYGWAGSILDVDLSAGKIEKIPFELDMGRRFIGGRGVNSLLLYESVKPGTDPLGPENVLVFGTGPLGGTLAPSSARMSVTSKCWHYNGVGTSNVGGNFAPELKYAGFDHVIIRGKAEKPVYIWIENERIELRSAEHLWGRNSLEADQLIRKELGDEVKVACIGLGGENLVRFSTIMVNMYRAAGQTGMGMSMGSKNLKAVVVRGTGSIEVAEPELLKQLSRELTRRAMENPIYNVYSQQGTPGVVPMFDGIGLVSIKNFQQSGNWGGVKDFSPEKLAKYYTSNKACFACPIHCGHYTEIQEGPYKGERGGALEFEHILPLGAGLDNYDTDSVVKSAFLCNEYGMCTKELGYTLSAAMEWYENGIITKKDTDGISLDWGNQEAIIAMIHKIGKREGFGDVLAEGAVHAAKMIGKGAEDYISHCKGMVIGSQDTRATKGGALNQATSTIPAKYEEGSPFEIASDAFPPEVFNQFYGPEFLRRFFGTDIVSSTSYNKAMGTIKFQNICRIFDALEICKFMSPFSGMVADFKEVSDLFFAATGLEVSPEDMETASERINDLERAFAVREGMTREDDHLRGKIAREAIKTGPFKGEKLDPEKFEIMLDEYYELRGWDRKSGIPTRAKLEKVGLSHVADELEKLGKLPPN